MIRLFVNFYTDANPLRQLEIDECLSRNMMNPMIDEVQKVICEGRPTYRELFRLANKNIQDNDITIIANADIYFEEHDVALINYFLQPGTCYALSRWNKLPDGSLQLFDRADSQDSWIFKGPIKEIPDCDFTMGRPGCDNAICQRIEAAGYAVQNPSRDIKSIHVHLTDVRNYNASQTVEQPYKLIAPHNLPSLPVVNWVTEIASLPSDGQHSQYGEDAIIDHIFKNIGLTNQYLVDLGAGAYGGSTMSNTRKLKQAGWKGFGVDVKNKGEDWIIERFIKPDNVVSILAEQNTPKEFDFLNLDIDSCDFWVLKQLLAEYAPRCICTEFNGTLRPEVSIVLKYEEGYTWDETNKYGYSFAAGKKLLEEHGYRIIYNMHNQNIFALKKELAKGLLYDVPATQVWYHPENPHAVWEVY
jgi:hypothetical protein